MSPERWQVLQKLFHELSDLPAEEREKRLAAVDDPTIRRDVRALLAADENPPEILSADVGDLSGLLDEPVAGIGDPHVGPYRLVEEIGSGGMGAVYRAEHDELDRTVALKLMRMPFASPEHVRRFLVERRVLARVEHPAIARLLDAGTTRHGIPYFAMELVDGEPMTDHCDRRSLSVPDRLALFASTCDAAAYAHRNLVVHRDLKPSNVFVTEDGRVKLLDFGVARLLVHVSETDDTLTDTGHGPLTPAYAAPEQVSGGDVTTATDVYSLGVMLYELLTGRRPYDLHGASPAEVERAVCHTVPLPPSRVIGRDESAEVVAAARGTTPDRLRRALAGDLDTIACTALAKEPERRYASAAELAADLRNVLADRPITARPSTPAYHVRKFIARHRAAVGVAAAVVMLIAVLVGTYTYQLRGERDRARAAVAYAEREAATSERMTAFLTDLFDAANPQTAAGDTLTAYDLLTRGVAQADALSGDPVVKGRMLSAMGRSFSMLGAHDRADSLLTRAQAALASASAPPVFLAQVHSHRAWLRYQQGRLPEADSLYGVATALRREHSPLPTPAYASDLSDHGFILTELGRYETADSLHRRALALRRHLLGPRHPQVAKTLNNLALVHHRSGRYPEADSLLRAALRVYGEAGAVATIDGAKTWANLALTRQKSGDLAGADSSYALALRLYRTVVGPNHPLTAQATHNRGGLLRTLGRVDDAETHYRRALSIWTAAHGPDHPDVAASLNSIALLLMDTDPDRLDESESLLRRSLAINERAFGPSHGTVATNLNNLATLLRKQERYDEAYALQERVLAADRALLGDAHPFVGGDYRNLAYIRALQDRHADALPLYEQALAIQSEALGPDHHAVFLTKRLMGTALTALGRYADAEPVLRESYDGLRAALGDDHPETARAQAALASLRQSQTAATE